MEVTDIPECVNVFDVPLVKARLAKVIVPGHGPHGNSWAVVLDAQQRYLDTLLKGTRQAIADGLFMEEAIDTIGISEKNQWLLFDQQHRTNVSKAFVELEWE